MAGGWRDLAGGAHDEESGLVLGVVFDVGDEDVEAVELGRQARADGGGVGRRAGGEVAGGLGG